MNIAREMRITAEHRNNQGVRQTARHIIVAFMMLSAFTVAAQENQPISTATNADTAKAIVDRYLTLMNYEGLPADSMLYIESSIYDFHDRSDTLVMKRWFLPPHNHRVELWVKGELQLGYLTNGIDNARRYDTIKQVWQKITVPDYYDKGAAYDFHSPLYKWRANGTEMQYLGEKELYGVKVYEVHVETPGMHVREYLFEKENGLLFFVIEHPEVFGGDVDPRNTHVDWRAFTDYIHIGSSLLPYTESYRRNGHVTVINHRYAFVKKEKKKFE